jgi:hypothetical protein
MKKILIPGLLVLFALNVVFQANAQKDKKDVTNKERKVTIQIVKEENGKKKVTDTTFVLKEGEDLDEVLKKHGIESKSKSGSFASFDIKHEKVDSLNKIQEEKVIVWSSDNDDSFKKVIATGDGKKKIIHISDDVNFHFFDDGDEMIEISKGDTTKRIRKIVRGHRMKPGGEIMIIRKPGAPGHFRIPRTYRYFNDSIEISDFTFPDDSILNKRFYFKQLQGDSMDVVIQREFNDQFTHEFFEPQFHFEFDTRDFDPVHRINRYHASKAKIDEPSEVDLKGLKLEKKYKLLDLKDFMLVLNGLSSKLSISFNAPEKGDLSIQMTDEKGNSFLVVELKSFQGRFEKEFRIPKGEHILYISQNKKYYVKKVIIE